MEAMKSCAIMRAVDGKTSNWLTVMPITRHHFDLSAVEFRDALAIRYGRLLRCCLISVPLTLTPSLMLIAL